MPAKFHHAKQRNEANELLKKLNDLRARYGGDTYPMGSIKGFAAAQYGEGGDYRIRFLKDWFALYDELAPRFALGGVSVQFVDNLFIADRSLGTGPTAYRKFAEALLKDPAKFGVKVVSDTAVISEMAELEDEELPEDDEDEVAAQDDGLEEDSGPMDPAMLEELSHRWPIQSDSAIGDVADYAPVTALPPAAAFEPVAEEPATPKFLKYAFRSGADGGGGNVYDVYAIYEGGVAGGVLLGWASRSKDGLWTCGKYGVEGSHTKMPTRKYASDVLRGVQPLPPGKGTESPV